MKKKSYLLLFLLVFALFVTKTYALTIRETMDENDGYTTLEEGSVIIGVTRFSADTIVTASKAATAGVNDVMLYLSKNGNTNGYKAPGVYYYVDPYVGWFFLDSENQALPVTDKKELEKLEKLDIYYVNNVEKVLQVSFNENIDENTLPDGVIFKDNKLFINATIQKIEFKTTDKKDVSYIMDPTTSKFIENIKTCYTVKDGIILSYNKECGNEVIIPTEINNEKITGIDKDAFKNTNLTNVVIPSEITSLGSNAFAENELESVIIKDKYNESDFSFYGDNVFGKFNKISYENELTKILNHVESDYKIKYYKDFDITNLKTNLESTQYGLKDYISSDLINMFKENGYDKEYEYCYDGCKYEEKYLNKDNVSKDIYGISLIYLDNYKYNIIIEKYDEGNDKVHTASKEINVTFEESGIKENNNIVLEAIENIQTDNRFDGLYEGNEKIITRLKYIKDVEDLYDIKVIITPATCGTGIVPTDEIVNVILCKLAYVLKDDVIYQYLTQISITGLENYYYPTLETSNYENLDEYTEDALKEFTKNTGINNYQVYLNNYNKAYTKVEQEYKTGDSYEIELIDIENQEKWIIKFVDYYKDQYNELGFTKEECFEFSDGIISGYNGTCGANVKIPDKINNQDVIEIGLNESREFKEDDLFYKSGIKSIILPNNLQKIGLKSFANNQIKKLTIPNNVKYIGDYAFENNEIEELVLPYGIEEIRDYAFANNQIKDISLPKSIKFISSNILDYNEIDDSNKLVYARNEDGTVDKTVLMLYRRNQTDKVLELPEGIIEIRNNAIYNNNTLEEIILPSTLEKIGNESLGNIYNVKEIIIPSNVKSIGTNAIYGISLKILIKNKASEKDFEYLGQTPFGKSIVTYENRVEIEEITLNKTSITLEEEETDTLIATINPNNATDKDIIWTSSDINVVTVDNGIIKAISEGNATIKASIGEKNVSCTITVNKKTTYTYQFEKIEESIANEYYLYIVSSKGDKVSGKVKVTHINDKDKEFDVPETGLKIVKDSISSIEIIEIN